MPERELVKAPNGVVLGFVERHDSGYWMAWSTAGADHPKYCYGAAAKSETAKEIILNRWSHCSCFK